MERKFHGYTWNDLNHVLDFLCELADDLELTEEQDRDFDIGIQCIVTVMNMMSVDVPILWDEESK